MRAGEIYGECASGRGAERKNFDWLARDTDFSLLMRVMDVDCAESLWRVWVC